MLDEPKSIWAKLAIITAFLTALASIGTLVSAYLNGNGIPALLSPSAGGSVQSDNIGRFAELEAKRNEEDARIAALAQKRREAEELARLAEAETKRKAEEARLEEIERRRREAKSLIRVVSGSYGPSCGPAAGNHSEYLASECNDKTTCQYYVDNRFGDPFYNCAKDFKAEWRCNGDPQVHTAYHKAVQNEGYNITLSCFSRVKN